MLIYDTNIRNNKSRRPLAPHQLTPTPLTRHYGRIEFASRRNLREMINFRNRPAGNPRKGYAIASRSRMSFKPFLMTFLSVEMPLSPTEKGFRAFVAAKCKAFVPGSALKQMQDAFFF